MYFLKVFILDVGINELIDAQFLSIEEEILKRVDTLNAALENTHLEAIEKLNDYEKELLQTYIFKFLGFFCYKFSKFLIIVPMKRI